jgi:rhodanese-related sulfurtransferase
VAAFAALATAPSTVILDVRTPSEFATGHLTGAHLLDIRAADFDSKLGALDPRSSCST